MKNNLSIWLLLCIIFTGFNACKNDIQLNADYKEIMVVYGLLDINDTVHYVRIERAFQNTNATAQSIAQKPDSIYFDTLEVNLVESGTGTIFHLSKEVTTSKDSGYFQNKVNVLYRFKGTLNPQRTYTLYAKNPKTNYQATSTTPIVANPTRFIYPAGDTIDLLAGKNMKINFTTGVNAMAYDMFLRFKWNEYDSVTNALLGTKYLDFYLERSLHIRGSISVPEVMESTAQTDDIIAFIGGALSAKKGVKRQMTDIDVCHAGAADDLNVYLDISKPSIGIVQKKPEFSNVANGYGIFSSRNVYFKYHHCNFYTNQTLRKNPATSHLGFFE